MNERGGTGIAETSRRRATAGLLIAAIGLVWVMVLMVASATARAAAGDLTFDGCIGSSTGCTFVAGNVLNAAEAVAVSPNGQSVYVGALPSANAMTIGPVAGALVHFFADANGHLTYDSCLSDDGTGGACVNLPGSPLQDLSDVAVSPNGASVYTAANGYDDVGGGVGHLFADPSSGQLTWDGCVSDDGSGGACLDADGTHTMPGVRAVAVSPNGDSVYASADTHTGGGVVHLSASPGQGQLSYKGCVSNDGDGGYCLDIPGTTAPILGPIGVAVSPNGASVYLTAEGELSHLFANPDRGLLSWDGCVSDDGSGGACADVPGSGDPLTALDSVAVSPDGSSVYAVGADGVAHFTANPSQGQLTWQGCISADGSGGTCSTVPTGGAVLSAADAVAISPDGQSLYVTSAELDAVSWFSLGADGDMTFQGCISDAGIAGCTDPPGAALDGADSVAVSPDGKSVYVTAAESGTVVHFVRTPAASGTGSGGSGAGSGGSGAGSGGSGGGSPPSGTGSSGGAGGTPGPGSAPTHATTATVARHRVTLSGAWPKACLAHTASLTIRLTAVSLGGRASFSSAHLFLDRGLRIVRHRTVRRNGHPVAVRTVSYKPERAVRALPANATLRLAHLGHGSHQVRAVVSYRKTTKAHGRSVTGTVSKTLTLRFQVC